ncbi:MAG TPA: DUF2478 domain-containing protein [Beijerinckiaceae bacterium]|nr:DUF2478 domain-containing protein [Beijerinckiaceae bacterium]
MTASIGAIVYPEGIYPDRMMTEIAHTLSAAGTRLAGVVQHNTCPPGRSRCDMLLEDLRTGAIIRISEDRGEQSRGCRINPQGLAEASASVAAALAGDLPELLIINKFGKMEAEGDGLRDLIAQAIGQDVPVLIGVPQRNLDAWRAFAGSFADELPPMQHAVRAWLQGRGLLPLEEARSARLRAPALV